ncbi:MAG: ABC transporter permease [Acidobacteriota bacterium]|nr:ABC transporter permease [Acidobacteriota bacterium]
MSWSRFFRRSRWDDERAQELEAHLAHEIDDNIARGMTPQAAAMAAHRRLGNATQIREEIYNMNTLGFVETIWQDLRYGFRLLRRNPTFSIVAILTLALGTGANAAIFQLVNSVRMRELPVERPQELASISIDTNDKGRTGKFSNRRPIFTEPLWQAIHAEQQAFSHLFAWGITSWNLATDGEYLPARGLYVTDEFFQTLAVGAQVGRVLGPGDDQKGCSSPGAVLSHGLWQARYGGNRAVIGQSISLDNRPFTIVGVTPPEFFGVEVGRAFDVILPLCAEPLIQSQTSIGRRDAWFLDIMGRLEPGWTAERAQAQLEAVSSGIFQATLPPRYNPETAKQYLAFKLTSTAAATGVSGVRRAYETQLWVLLGATGLVLLITCANLANLMLARATAREREIAVRLAIGASRRRIVRQMLSESLLIAGLGALGGIFLAQWISRSLVLFLSTSNNMLFVDLSPDWRVYAFITAVAVFACLLFGLSPALKATGTSPTQTMQAGGRSSTDSHERFALRRALVVVQVALSMVLIVGAMLFGRSLRNLATVDPGFRPDGIVAVGVDLRRSSIDPAALQQVQNQALERVKGIPGVIAAAEALIVPMSGSGWNQNIVIDGVEKDGSVNMNRIGGDYFRVMETPIIAGRPFGIDDRRGSPATAIVNESFAKRYFGGAHPVGRTFQIAMGQGEARPHFQIVGLVRDTKYNDLREEFMPISYFPAAQETEPSRSIDLILRSDMPLSTLTPVITRAMREVAPNSTVSYDTVGTYVRDSLVTERLMATLSGFFGLLALLIATIGLYGVMSYMVSRRKVEIGIRMALGADPRTVVRMVLRESGLLLAAGVIVGVGLAALVSRSAASLLFGLDPDDPLSFLLATAALGVVSLLAAWVPARRASRLTPTVALRAD